MPATRLSVSRTHGPSAAPRAAQASGVAWLIGLGVLTGLLLSGCGGGGGGQQESGIQTLSPTAALGKLMFSDAALSASGQQSCATCHVKARAFTADPATDHGLPVALGGPNMDRPGFVNTPSLLYANFTPAFHFESDGTPVGGFFRDGRAASLADQAMQPFLASNEMANADAAAVVAKLKTRPYLDQFVQLFGAAVLDDPSAALARMGAAIAAFEAEAEMFHPFTSKFDAWQRGSATLTTLEQKGFALFNDPTRGNCAACHTSTSADGTTPPLFTDFSYDNLGLPRNAAIPANDEGTTLDDVPSNGNDGVHRYYDMGLCGPFRTDLAHRTDLCGAFKVPSLRDVALTAPYFHNGAFSSLQDAVAFYVRRDTNPEQWFPATDGASAGHYTKFNDLPRAYGGQFVADIHTLGSDYGYQGNVNTSEVPYNRHIGDQPALAEDDIKAVVAFLCTLTDGYDAANPNAYDAALPTQCPQSTTASASNSSH
jgi:cytochrome c peroxidase